MCVSAVSGLHSGQGPGTPAEVPQQSSSGPARTVPGGGKRGSGAQWRGVAEDSSKAGGSEHGSGGDEGEGSPRRRASLSCHLCSY